MDATKDRPARPGAPVLRVDPAAVLDAMAREIRAIYSAQRRYASARRPRPSTWGQKVIPRWDGGEDPHGAVHVPIWPRIAQICAVHQIEPRLFVEAQFAGRAAGEVPQPDALLRAEALERYHAHVRGSEARLRLDWRAESGHFLRKATTREYTLGETRDEAAAYVLADPDSNLSALFRYCLAHLGQSPGLMARYRIPALMQYAFRRYAYDRAWADHLPDGLRANADAFLAQFSRKV
jgi:hypothetical protein